MTPKLAHFHAASILAEPRVAVRVDAYGHEPLWATRDLYSTRDYAETAAASINRQSGPFPLQ